MGEGVLQLPTIEKQVELLLLFLSQGAKNKQPRVGISGISNF
jgi:hypothetical protein